MAPRPRLLVLAGVNGAGKSSVGGAALEAVGEGRNAWYNPDAATRELVAAGLAPEEANAQACLLGKEQLEVAIAERLPYAFETTLGANTMTALIGEASKTHAVHVWFCGLDSPERHIARVRARVARGGHDIPEEKIRQRYEKSQVNLIGLLPALDVLNVYDNSTEAGDDGEIPDPRLLLHVEQGRVLYPSDVEELARTPEWAMAIVEAALELAGY